MIPKFFDTDHHVTEPPDFWTGRLPQKFQEQAPKFMHHPELGPGWSWDNGKTVRPMGVASVGSEDPRKIGDKKSFEDLDPACYDAKKRIEGMDIDGVQACLLFPSGPAFFHAMPDDEFYYACVRGYNDAVYDWASAGDIRRILPGAMLPMISMEAATDEVTRVAKKGFKHVISNKWPSLAPMPLASDDRFFATLQDLDMPVSVHGFGGGRIRAQAATPAAQPVPASVGTAPANLGHNLGGRTTNLTAAGVNKGDQFKNTTRPNGMQEMVAAGRAAGLSSTQPLAAFIFSGVLDRFPKLRLSLIETSLGWLPAFMEQLDAVYAQQRWLGNTQLARRPSEYVEHFYANFDREWMGVKYRDWHIGTEHMTFGTDYPHIGSFYPHSRFYIELVMQGVPEDQQEKILWSNAAKLYKIA